MLFCYQTVSSSFFFPFRAFNVPSTITLSASLPNEAINVHAVTEAICTVIELHDILRMVIRPKWSSGSVVLCQELRAIANFRDSLYSVLDITGLSDSHQTEVMRKELNQFALKRLYLDKQLFSFKVYVLEPSLIVVAFNVHHIIYDDVSILILAHDLLKYIGERCPPRKPFTYQLQQSVVPVTAPQVVKEEVEQWKGLLSGIRHILRFSVPGVPSTLESRHAYVPLSVNVQKALQRTSKSLSIPQTTLVITAISCALGVLARVDDFVLGLQGMNRTEKERNYIGCYAKILPLRMNFSSKPLLSQLVKTVLTNCGMVFDSSIQLPDLVSAIPCLQHKEHECSPFHVLLSIYHFDISLPPYIAVGGVGMNVKLNHAFQVHLQSDLFIEIHPSGTLNPTLTIHYQYSNSCFNGDLILLFQESVSNFITGLQDEPNPVISMDLFPNLKILSEWRNRVLPKLPSLPDIARLVSDKKGKPFVTLETKIRAFEPHRMLFMGAFAYILSRFFDKDEIGLLFIKRGSVLGLYFDKLTGGIENVVERFANVLERSKSFEISLTMFNGVFQSLEKCKERHYLTWCEDDTKSEELACELGVHVNCISCDKDLVLKISALASLFDKESLPRFIKCFERFYKNVGRYRFEQVNIEDIPYWQDGWCEIPSPSFNISLNVCYIRQFEQRAIRKYPHSIALTYQDTHMSYGFVQRQVKALGSVVYRNAVQHGSNIGLYLTRTPLLYISLLSVLWAGCSYTPISLDMPIKRLKLMLKLGKVGVLLTESSLLPNLKGYLGAVVCVDALSLFSNVPSATRPETGLPLPFCILYTSGTTGMPKGVVITNENVLHAINNLMDLSTPEESGVTLASTNIAFDAHIIDSLTPLLRGSRIVIVEDLSCMGMAVGVTHAFATPSAVCRVAVPASVQCLIVGGEAFTSTCYEKTKDVEKVVNVYGPTECTVFVSSVNVRESYDPNNPSNIGQLVPECALKVANTSGNQVPPGFPGILYIYGPQVAKGYYNNNHMTEMGFALPEQPMKYPLYRTNDWVRLLPDHSLQFLGRLDHQVKLGGYRFELLEVENIIYNHHSVKGVCAFVLNYGTPSAVLVACVSPSSISVTSLIDHVKTHLPWYMVPKFIVPIQEMPLNQAGKIDRVRLKAMVSKKVNRDVKEIEMESNLARSIARAFGCMLGISPDKYSINDDFFARGGNSLLVFPLTAIINQRLGSNVVNTSNILQFSTPLKLANHIISTMSLKQFHICGHEETGEKEELVFDSKKSEFFIKLGENCDKDSITNACSRWITPPNVNLPGKECYLIKGTAKAHECSLDFIDNPICTSPKMLEVSLRLPLEAVYTSPSNFYCDRVLPLQYLRLATHPECFFKFKFLDSIPLPSLPDDFERDVTFGNIQRASENLLRKTGIVMSASALGKYADTCNNLGVTVLIKHLRIKSLLAFRPEEPAVTIQEPMSSEKPLFLVHGGVIGWSLPYILLAKKFGFYCVALQRTIHTPTNSFKQMAAYYMQAVLDVQPDGPYSLLGVGYGACLAYEIAYLLTTNGHAVKQLTMINDSPVHECRPALFDLYGSPLPETNLDPTVFFADVLELQFPREKLKMSPDQSQLHSIIGVLMNTYPWIDFGRKELHDLYMHFYNGMRCLWDHVPQAIDGISNCLLVRNQAHPFFKSRDFGMSKLVNNLVVVVSEDDLDYLSQESVADFVVQTIIQHTVIFSSSQ